jgi:ABC-2 type transport system permease protein
MKRNTIRYWLSGTLGIVLAVALVIMVNWLGARHYVSGDWTSSNVYSVSSKTQNILSELSEPIRVVVFMTPASPLYDQVHELLNRYAAASDKITVEYIDPDKEPLKTRQLAQQFGISAADTVVFSAGDRTKYVTADQMADYDYAGMQYGQSPSLKSFKGEEEFTAAILSLVAPGVPKVYFVTGHGEPKLAAAAAPGGGNASERSLATLKEVLKRDNIDAEETTLLGGKVPDDADVLAIIGPTQPYTETEVKVLKDYLDGGGRLLVALDPLIQPDGTMRSTRLEGLLSEYGISVGNDLVVDPSRRLPFYDLSAVYLTDFPAGPLSQGLEGSAALFVVARSVAPASGGQAKAVVDTSDEGWGETNLKQLLTGQPVAKDAADVAGPVAVGVTVEGSTKPADTDTTQADGDNGKPAAADDATPPSYRIAAFGDSDFLSDFEISNAGNLTLANNAFSWLAARQATLGIAARPVEQVNLFLSQQQMRTILLITLLGMPGAAIVLGVLVWRRRRH